MCLTVDTLVAGNREKDHRTGFTTPPKLTLQSLMSFAMRPKWVFNYLTGKKFELSNVKKKTDKGTNISKSVIEYINEQYDPAMGWKDAEYCAKKWNGPFALKGVMSVEDAKRAIDIGCTAIMISNHGGRQLDGSRSPFDQVKAISDAVGDELEIILDGGVRRGTHVLKALAAGAKACSFGKMFLFSLAAGGQEGVEHLLKNMRDEINRNMVLMGCTPLKPYCDLSHHACFLTNVLHLLDHQLLTKIRTFYRSYMPLRLLLKLSKRAFLFLLLHQVLFLVHHLLHLKLLLPDQKVT